MSHPTLQKNTRRNRLNQEISPPACIVYMAVGSSQKGTKKHQRPSHRPSHPGWVCQSTEGRSLCHPFIPLWTDVTVTPVFDPRPEDAGGPWQFLMVFHCRTAYNVPNRTSKYVPKTMDMSMLGSGLRPTMFGVTDQKPTAGCGIFR